MTSDRDLVCTKGGCRDGRGQMPICRRCGWEQHEAARRKNLPLVPDGKGKLRMCVGTKVDFPPEGGAASE